MSQREHAPRGIVAAFALSVLSALGYAVAYALGMGTQWLGGTLGGAFLGLAVGLALWAQQIDTQEPEYVEERELSPSPATQWSSFEQALTVQPVPRVKVLWSMFALALGTIGVTALFPVRSLWGKQGGNPDAVLSRTSWFSGRALVTEEGARIKAEDLDYGSVLPAFPEDNQLINADAATMLIRVEPQALVLPPERKEWVVDGVVAYSRLCTHAGCPVGLYAEEYFQLLCPCHHSIFDVLHGAQPVSGPAARPLPQLPLGTDEDGYLVALGDFTEPTGAGWWGFPE
ncbi:MAG TPA: Rieske 2Fe-2S domain-containing protein [Nocardioidaceae bacterium]|nr:Rieske 2Fe-2S domain-containing protein [Nocardioidaceae bacterium]